MVNKSNVGKTLVPCVLIVWLYPSLTQQQLRRFIGDVQSSRGVKSGSLQLMSRDATIILPGCNLTNQATLSAGIDIYIWDVHLSIFDIEHLIMPPCCNGL